MKQIKASEVQPGMEVQFDLEGWDVKGTVGTVSVRTHAVWIYTEKQCEMSLELDAPVTVLAEPTPEEPTAFGARVIAGCRYWLRAPESVSDDQPWLAKGSAADWASWGELCARGHVTIIDADPSWTAPEDAPAESPVVPERIEEWPEHDEHLRAYRWRDRDGDLWYSVSDSRNPWVARFPDRTGAFHPYPKRGPWTRVTDA